MTDVGRIRVMVADDHSLFRRGMLDLLSQDKRIEIVAEAVTGDEAVEKARERHPDVIVMDVRMPHMNGIEAARRIKREMPKTEVIMVSAVDDDDYILEAIEAGASGYVVKNDDPDLIVEAIHRASEGKAFLPPAIARRVMDSIASSSTSLRSRQEHSLTQRETIILQMVAGGKRNREIAGELGVSERTVANHIANMYAKLHVEDRAQAVLYGVRKGLIKL